MGEVNQPTVTDADRERAKEFRLSPCPHETSGAACAGWCIDCLGAELAKVRGEEHHSTKKGYIEQLSRLEERVSNLLSPGPCGKHPKAYLVEAKNSIWSCDEGKLIPEPHCPLCEEIKQAGPQSHQRFGGEMKKPLMSNIRFLAIEDLVKELESLLVDYGLAEDDSLQHAALVSMLKESAQHQGAEKMREAAIGKVQFMYDCTPDIASTAKKQIGIIVDVLKSLDIEKVLGSRK